MMSRQSPISARKQLEPYSNAAIAPKTSTCAGYAVNNGLIKRSPRVQGNFHGNDAISKDDHKITRSLRLTGKMKAFLSTVSLKILKFKDSGANITIVTDISTDAQDNTITPGDNILIESDKIKVVGESQESGTEPDIDIFSVDSNENKIQAIRFNKNAASRVKSIGRLARV
jgi:hypothetical protein